MQRRNEQGQTLEEFLAEYDASLYPRPSIAVDMAVFTLIGDNLGVLMIERRNHPCIGEWALPGGFLEIDEEVECAALRELYEETGIRSLRCRPIGVFAKVGRDPRTRNVSLAYMSIAPEGTLNPNAGDDARDARLFLINTENIGKFSAKLSFREDPDFSLRYNANITYDAFSGYSVDAEKGDLAFDHSLLLTHALLELVNIERGTASSMLSPDAPERAAAVLLKLEKDLLKSN